MLVLAEKTEDKQIMGKYVMSFDAGTTSERAIIFDHEGAIVSVAQK